MYRMEQYLDKVLDDLLPTREEDVQTKTKKTGSLFAASASRHDLVNGNNADSVTPTIGVGFRKNAIDLMLTLHLEGCDPTVSILRYCYYPSTRAYKPWRRCDMNFQGC
jgi:hypothetical protein